jgi:hypothetical protein
LRYSGVPKLLHFRRTTSLPADVLGPVDNRP